MFVWGRFFWGGFCWGGGVLCGEVRGLGLFCGGVLGGGRGGRGGWGFFLVFCWVFFWGGFLRGQVVLGWCGGAFFVCVFGGGCVLVGGGLGGGVGVFVLGGVGWGGGLVSGLVSWGVFFFGFFRGWVGGLFVGGGGGCWGEGGCGWGVGVPPFFVFLRGFSPVSHSPVARALETRPPPPPPCPTPPQLIIASPRALHVRLQAF